MKNLRLSITTIGDLLLRDRISCDKEGNPIDHVHLTVPDYQRPYKWSARNATQLLDDIIEARNANKETYRVGTLILHRDADGTHNIVDGQQRAITFALLLHALYETEPAEHRRHIGMLDQKIYANGHSRRNIPNNLNAFRRRIQRNTSDEIENIEHRRDMQRLREYIENRCELIVVTTDDISDAFQFFDSQNARGKALYPHDLLKAYHLREMSDAGEDATERTVRNWERIPQDQLASFFGEYLYPIKEWINGNRAYSLNEQNIYKFKGITRKATTPFAQFYKGAYSYASFVNSSPLPFVTGIKEMRAFQLNAPIIAGQAFFNYTRHYYDILEDIRDNSKYKGYYIKDNLLVKTLDKYYSKGVGYRIVRLLFDSALLLYVDRFCPASEPSKEETALFEQFVEYAFIWAYSLRAQYSHLGWNSAQNYILEKTYGRDIINSANLYKIISGSDTPLSLLSTLSDILRPLSRDCIRDRKFDKIADDRIDEKDSDGVYMHYLHFFKTNSFYTLRHG